MRVSRGNPTHARSTSWDAPPTFVSMATTSQPASRRCRGRFDSDSPAPEKRTRIRSGGGALGGCTSKVPAPSTSRLTLRSGSTLLGGGGAGACQEAEAPRGGNLGHGGTGTPFSSRERCEMSCSARSRRLGRAGQWLGASELQEWDTALICKAEPRETEGREGRETPQGSAIPESGDPARERADAMGDGAGRGCGARVGPLPSVLLTRAEPLASKERAG